MKCILALLALVSQLAFATPSSDEITLDVGIPPVMVARHTLTQRSSRLVRFYEAGVIGLGYDGMVKMHDAAG